MRAFALASSSSRLQALDGFQAKRLDGRIVFQLADPLLRRGQAGVRPLQEYGAYGSFMLLVGFPRLLNLHLQRRDLFAARGRTLGSVRRQLTESLVDIVEGVFRGFTLSASVGELLLTLWDCQSVSLKHGERALRLRQSAFVGGAWHLQLWLPGIRPPHTCAPHSAIRLAPRSARSPFAA